MGFSSGGCWQQLHGNFTPSHACGCAAQCCEGVQRGSIIVLPVRSSPASCHACFPVRCWSLCFSPRGKAVVAHPPFGSVQGECVQSCPMLRRHYFAPLSLSRSKWGRFTPSGKGDALRYFSALKDKTARISFDCSRSRKSSSMP